MDSRLRSFPLLRYSAAGVIAITLAWIVAGRVHATGQNPVPLINQPLAPASALPGSRGFTLTVSGAGFVSGSVVRWNGSARPTTFVSSTQLTAGIAAADVATAGTASVTVFNPPSGGGASNVQFFAVTHPESAMTFSETDTPLPVGLSVSAVADFNGDGKLDLVGGSYLSTAVSILLGNGDGTFQPPVDYALSNGPTQIAVADFNGDGKLDLAVATADDRLATLLGNGDGTFQPPASFNIGGAASSMVAGDFNGDGKTDLVVTTCEGFEHCVGAVSVLLGNGDGTFQPPSIYSTVLAGPLAMGDFNRDGKLDLAVSYCSDSYCTGGGVAVLLGNGDGTLQSPVTYPANGAPRSIIAADFNGDGKLDLAVATFSATGSPIISILLGKGDGTIVAPLIVSTDPSLPSQSMVAGDFNGDGKLDLGLIVLTTSLKVAVLLGKGNGTFQAPVLLPALPAAGATVMAGDFNGEGRLDLAEAIEGFAPEGAVPTNTLAVLLQTTAVTLAPTSLVFGSTAIGSASAAGTVTLDNNTNSPLDVSGLAVSGPFALTGGCGTSLPAFTLCSIGVTFKPAAAGAQTGTLTVTDSAPGSPQAVALNGMGSDFSASASPATSTVTAGQKATYTLSLMPLDGFNQSVALSCSGAPSESTCSVDAPSVTLNGVNPSTASVTVTTTAPGAVAGSLGGGGRGRVRLFLWALVLAMLAALADRGRRERQPRLAGRLAFGIAVFLLLLGASCGGAGQTPPSNSGPAGTPAGSYTLTLNATSGSLSHPAMVTLVVN